MGRSHAKKWKDVEKKVMQRTVERCKVTESNAKMVSRKKKKNTQKTTHACEHNGKR